MKTLKQGFHLIEILITLSIMGILASIAIPQFSYYFAYEKRLAAEMILGKTAIALEKYFIENNTYQDATLEKMKISIEEVKKAYRFSIQTHNSYYLLTAIPINNQAQRDKLCGALSLNSLGEKSISGPGDQNECWGH